jgi:hypothetical protein
MISLLQLQMKTLNQYCAFLLVALTTSLLGCVNMTTAATANNWIMDDGVMELTPEYTVQHIQGKDYSDVYAAFNFIPQKKLVRLREGDAITVNGQAFEGIADSRGYYYRTRIPVTEGTFTLTLARASNKTMMHSFELPVLGIKEVPKVYRPYEKLLVPVQYVEPPFYVKDSYSLPISGPSLRFTLDSITWKKDNQYQIDRLPDIQDGRIVFRHITERAPPPGMYSAKIFRQHRIVLSEMSNASRTGWITLSNSLPFTIEVK